MTENLRIYQLIGFGELLQDKQSLCPEPTGSQVILRVLAAGVCHSDLHIFEGHHDLGGGRKI